MRPAAAVTTPARAGPPIIIVWKTIRFSAMAAASWPGGTSFGMNVRRAGALIAPPALAAASSAYSSHTERRPMSAWANSRPDTAVWAAVTASTSLRRSTRSASVPPGRAMTSIGTSVATPRPPTAAVERVTSQTCRLRAKFVIATPTPDSMLPSHRRRNAGISRSGAMSVRSFTPLL